MSQKTERKSEIPIVAMEKHVYHEPSTHVKILDRWVDSYVKHAVHRPKTVFCSCCFIIWVLMGIAVAVGINMAAMGNNDWLIPEARPVERMDAINDAYDSLDDAGNTTTQSEVPFYQTFMYFTKSRTNVFTPEHILSMCELEATLIDMDRWNTKYCYVDADGAEGECSSARDLSIVNYFYGDDIFTAAANSNTDVNCYLLNESYVETKAQYLVDQMNSESGRLDYGYYMARNTEEKGYSSRTRSGIAFGGPLRGFSKLADINGDKQAQKYQSFLLKWARKVWKRYDMKNEFLKTAFMDTMDKGDLEMLIFSTPLWDVEGFRLFEGDFIMVIFAFLFVYCWILQHLRSCFLGTVAIIQIFLSIPASLFLYRVIFQIEYFSTMQQLVIFVVLGVGADDVFVMVDGWKDTAYDVPRDPGFTDRDWWQRRLKSCYIRTAQAVLNTSFTTAMAFCATAVSPIMPISTFGVFGAVCIIMNYIFVITLTPAAVIINEEINGCCCKKSTASTESDAEDANTEQKKEVEGEATTQEAPVRQMTFERRALEIYKTLVKKKPIAITLIICLLTYTALSAWWASMLVAPDEPEQWLPSQHMLERASQLTDKYVTNDDDSYAQLDIIWGIKGVNRKNFDPYYPNDNRGVARYDAGFDLFNTDTQAAIYDACDRLPSYECNKDGCDLGLLVRPNTTICFLSDFDTWVNTTHDVDTSTIVGNEAYRTQYMNWLKTFRETQYPLGDSSKSYEELIGFIDDELKFVGIRARMTMELFEPYVVKNPIEKLTKKFVRSIPKPDTAKHVLQYTFDWTWTPSQEGIVRGMTIGMAIAFPVAFGTLLIATRNAVLSFFAIFSVASVVAATLGMCWRYLGWALGTGEAIAGVMVIGLAVDYTIHLGHMYDHAGRHGHTSREARFDYAIDTMALTVIAGAITTAGAGVFMFACQSTFFPKMATLITGTIIFSLVYSLLFFMPLLYLAGPEGDFGKIMVLRSKSSIGADRTKSNEDGGEDGL